MGKEKQKQENNNKNKTKPKFEKSPGTKCFSFLVCTPNFTKIGQ